MRLCVSIISKKPMPYENQKGLILGCKSRKLVILKMFNLVILSLNRILLLVKFTFMFKVKTTARNEILFKIFRAATYASRDKSFTVSLIKRKKKAQASSVIYRFLTYSLMNHRMLQRLFCLLQKKSTIIVS